MDMKNLWRILVCVSFLLPSLLFSQVLEMEKTNELSKDARKGDLGSFNYDDAAKQYTLVFVREQKKETIYETMVLDYDFNLISDNSESLSLIEASKKYDFVDYDEEKWIDPVVVRVDALAWGQGNVALRKGTISREWVKPSSTSTVSGNYIVTTTVSGYWKYNFNEIDRLTPKIEMSVSDLISPKAPGFVRKMVENQAKKIYLVSYMTDEPSSDIQTGRRFFFPHAMSTAYLAPRKAFSAASGDIVVVGKQVVAWDKYYISRFVALKYAAADFSEKNRTMIEFEYGVDAIYKQILPDHSIALIFAPLPKNLVKPGKPNPNPRAYTFMLIDKDANVKERIEFESPSSKWDIHTIETTPAGELLIYGPASQKKNDAYFAEQYYPKYDNLQFMKIADGKVAFITATKIEDFAKKMQMPPDMKKIDSYECKDLEFGAVVFTSSGDILINGQQAEKGSKGNEVKYGDIYLFQFGADGNLKAQYGYKLAETNKDATSQPTLDAEFENPDGTLSWLVYEIAGVEKDRVLMYPQMAKIDLQSVNISKVATFGVSKKEAYYVDNSHPIVPIDNNTKLVFFGTDKKDKVLWFARVGLSK
jgi:hypothetical protein